MHVVLLCPLPHTVLRVRVLHVNYTQLVQSYPPDIRRKIARLVGNKITLRARIDSFHQNSDSSLGRKYKEEILQSVDKMVEASKKKRGGRRVRQVKEMFAITELRKQIQDLSCVASTLFPSPVPAARTNPSPDQEILLPDDDEYDSETSYV